MIQIIEKVNSMVNNFIWGVPAMVCIFGVGLYLSIRTGFLQIRKFPYAIRTTIGRIFRKRNASDGALTPFQAVCTALAATVGTGNIAGVAGAIAIGGPGAVFWMWISAILGMCTKFAEVTLAVHFREVNANGELVGGPMYYIKNGLGKKWVWLAYLFSAFRAHGVWYRKCDTGKYDHDGDQFGTAEFSHYRHRRSRDVKSDYRNSNGGSGGADPARRSKTDRSGSGEACTVYGAFLYRASAWCSSGEYSGAPICLCFDL